MTHDETAEEPREGPSPPLSPEARTQRSLGKHARRRIGTHLRAMYDSVVQQPIPSRFTDLIAQLEDGPGNATSNKP